MGPPALHGKSPYTHPNLTPARCFAADPLRSADPPDLGKLLTTCLRAPTSPTRLPRKDAKPWVPLGVLKKTNDAHNEGSLQPAYLGAISSAYQLDCSMFSFMRRQPKLHEPPKKGGHSQPGRLSEAVSPASHRCLRSTSPCHLTQAGGRCHVACGATTFDVQDIFGCPQC